MSDPVLPTVCPYLYYREAGAAIEWLAKGFGFDVALKREGPGGQVFHAELRLGDGFVFVGPGMAPFGTVPVADRDAVHAATHVYVDDVDAHCARARSAGATIRSEPADMPWGDRMYAAEDLEGQRWIFSQRGSPASA